MLLLFLLALAASAFAQTTGTCAPDHHPRTDSTFWNGWGADYTNTRFQDAVTIDAARLRLRWSFGVPGVTAIVGQPAVVGGVVYFGTQHGTIYALDARTGCQLWTFQADAMVRTAITVAAIQSGRYALLFGDAKAQVYALDVPTRKLRWKVKVDEHPWARLTGSPKLWEGKLFVPVSSNEEVPAAKPGYACCTFRGSVVAIDEETGKILWKTHTVPEGANGGAVWGSPAVDARRQRIYIGTGNAYTAPAAATTDAVLALDAATGAVQWSRQLTAGDRWTFGCVAPRAKHCEEGAAGPDFDIGAAPVLMGNRIFLGQKSGEVFALDADKLGEVLWRQRIGQGSALGGVMWGMAATATRLFVPLSDQVTPAPGGLFALDPATGRQLWSTLPSPRSAQMAPATATPQAVFSGDMAGQLRAYDPAAGKVIWEFNTAREFHGTVNGVQARGGSINGAGVVVAEGMVFAGSGYGILGGRPGNVLLAFGVD
ncbi:MAG: PQQ-binding-like beta-propeller repeat protein [Bryobacterales bacterium]|nr:PQQ-binding-like beta-propeller repeat protein [Bryobacterales bacterium]